MHEQRKNSQIRRSLLLLILLHLLWSMSVAFAHASLDAMYPAPGATVHELSEIRLTFKEPVQAYDGSITLLHNNRVVPVNIVNSDDPLLVRGRLTGEASAGVYQLIWRVQSEDEHELTGSYQFTYEPADNDFPVLSVLMVVLIGSLIVGSGGYLLWRRSRQQQPDYSGM